MNVHLTQQLREGRLAKGLKQSDVTELTGIKNTTLSNYENGNTEPDMDTFLQLCELYGLDYAEILGEAYGYHVSGNDFDIKKSEMEHIKKYRLISEKDTDGKALVDSTVNYLCNHIHMIQEEDSRLLELQNEKPAKITRLIRYYYGGVSAGSGVYMLNSTESKEIEIPVTPETSKADFVVPVSGNSMEPLFHDGDKILISQSDGTLEIGEIGIFVKNGDAFIKKLGQNELVSLNKEFDNIPLNDFDNVVCLGKVIGRLTDDMVAKD